MTLTEIENLSFADLKARKDELNAEIINGAVGLAAITDLAHRYVQARTDAKQRDEKLAEQGNTINTMNEGVAALQREKAAIQEQLTAATDKALQISDDATRVINSLNDKVTECREDIKKRDDAISHADRVIQELRKSLEIVESLAKARRTALADVMKTISPVLAAE